MKSLGKTASRTWLEIAIDAYLENIQDGGQESNWIHASWLSGSEEEIYTRLVGLDKHNKISSNLRRKFDDGLDVQRRYIRYFREMGILDEPEGWNEERGITVLDTKFGIQGNIDCRIKVPEGIKVPVELKAYNTELFKKFKYYPRFDHAHQLQVYLYLDGAPYGYLLPENKNDQGINPRKIMRDEIVIANFLRKAANVWNRVHRELEGGSDGV